VPCLSPCAQSFLLLHSLGGGTGSGVGTYILRALAVRRALGWALRAIRLGPRATRSEPCADTLVLGCAR
jgi:hypothetical protein